MSQIRGKLDVPGGLRCLALAVGVGMESMVSQGINLALFGMGTVFVFLTLLIGVTHSMSSLVRRFLPEATTLPAGQGMNAAADHAQPSEEELVAVITAAVQQFRSR